MNKREDLLSKVWTGPQLEIGGKAVMLSPIRYSILESWRNSLFDSSNTEQSTVEAMGELLLIGSATPEEIQQLRKDTPEERKAKIVSFMLETEDEFSVASAGVQERLESIRAAMVESESPGKEDALAHAS